MKIAFHPIGSIDDEIVQALQHRIGCVFGCPTETRAAISDLAQAYDPGRGQYSSSKLLASLAKRQAEERIVGIAEVDLFVPRLSYVFGEADVRHGAAIISLCRLRQEYYGLESDETMLLKRAVKETVHELGHTFGLGHCSDSKCVMHFSNSLADTDLKESAFCGNCRPRIIL